MMATLSTTPTSSDFLTFGQKFGQGGSNGCSQFQSQSFASSSFPFSPFTMLSAGGLGMTIPQRDPQEELFKEKLRKALQRNLDYLRRKDALLATPNPQSTPLPKKTRIDIRNPVIARRTTGIGAEVVAPSSQTPQRQEPNTRVYVSGFPSDITEEEVGILFSVLGKLKKVKLYTHPDGTKKGDSLITFTKPEAVAVACAHYNGKDIGGGCVLSVTPATFAEESNRNREIGDSGSSSQQPTSRSNADDELRSLLPSECLLGFDSSSPPLAVIWNLYDPKDPSMDTEFLNDLETDLRVEFEKHGPVSSMQLPLHSSLEGTAIIRFFDGNHAEQCVQSMKDRLFDGRTVQAQVLRPPPTPPQPLSTPTPPFEPTADDPALLLDPSVVEAVQGVEDFLNSLL